MLKRIRQMTTPEFWIGVRQFLIRKDVPQALFSVGVTALCFLLGSAALQWLYASKIATKPIIITSLIIFTALVLASVVFFAMKASLKFHIALSEKMDKIVEFSHAMKSLGLLELNDQIAYIIKQEIPLYVSSVPILNDYLEDATVKRYVFLMNKEKIKYYKGDNRLCMRAATYEQMVQELAKEISTLESAAVAQKEIEISALTDTLAKTVAQADKLREDNEKLRNICKTQSGRETAIDNSSIRRVVFWRVAGPLVNTLCEQGSRERPYTRTDIQAAFDVAVEEFPDLKEEIKQLLLAGKAVQPSEDKKPKPKSEFDLNGWAMEAIREGLGDLAKRGGGRNPKR